MGPNLSSLIRSTFKVLVTLVVVMYGKRWWALSVDECMAAALWNTGHLIDLLTCFQME